MSKTLRTIKDPYKPASFDTTKAAAAAERAKSNRTKGAVAKSASGSALRQSTKAGRYRNAPALGTHKK